ncbi:DUF349 domain-containing protein [Vreelandella zhaodongensis]|uniref:DUF349 domain-containing protein n=1 Tax=Vreelandella zhaodongensis TaxID=1176240 RepID=A0ABX2SVI0_VREZH|nr:DUF349 domain-containing protein [Halomonas zhaodongensis]NYS46110.1 DUF349 domain-containing protein [Halomonas zhaodongensis]
MHGLLRRLFAPRWQHPDPEVRLKALNQLDPQQPEQQQALKQLAQDNDSAIQLAALRALDDLPGLVATFPEHRQDDAWFNAVCQCLCGKEGHSDLQQRQNIVVKLTEPRLLNAIALQGDNLDLRLSALEQLTDDTDLIHQACHNGVAAVRHQAAKRIESEDSLKKLLKEARRDRQVIRQAREKLTQLRNDAEWLADQQAQREQLLKQLEQHANAPWEPLYGGRFRHLEREWERISHPPSVSQEQRFHQAMLSCRKTLHNHETQEQARQQSLTRRAEAERTRDQLLEGLEETLEGLAHANELTVQDIDSLRAQRQLLGQRWQSLSDQHPPSDTAQQRFSQALLRYEQCMDAWQRWQTISSDIETALANHDHAAITGYIKQCAWPKHLTPPEPLKQATALLAAKATVKPSSTSSLNALNAELDNFEHLLERGAFKSASRLYQRLKPSIDALTGDASKPLKTRLKQLGARLAELRDWRGFVAGPKREQLCASIEALADDQHMAEVAVDRHHRQLVKEWKSLGDAAANREQSARFRAASDRIHERLTPWREQLNQEREANLRGREALCEQLETLLDQPAEDADPDVLREIRDKARHQWRHYSPVPREQSEAIGRRFGAVRHRLQALIDQRAEQIATQKRTLIEHVQALQNETEEPLAARITRAKQLQQTWRTLGRAPKGEEQALWKTFRHTCDQLFAQRDAHKQEQAARQQQTLDKLQTIIDEMDSWQPTHAEELTTLETYLSHVSQLEPLPRNRRSDGMQRRLSGIVRAKRDRLSRLEVAHTVQLWHAVLPLVNAHIEADQQALAGEQPFAIDPKEVLGERLPDIFKDAHQLRNQARLATSVPLSDDQLSELEDNLSRLRVHLSLLALGSVNQRDEPLRLAIQVERLNEGIHKERSRPDEIIDILASLMALGPIPSAMWQKEAQEFDNLMSRLARVPQP